MPKTLPNNPEDNQWEEEIDGVVASIIREYVHAEGIDFVNRSQAAKGTIDWSDYVARHIKNNRNTCYASLHNLLSQQAEKQRESKEKILYFLRLLRDMMDEEGLEPGENFKRLQLELGTLIKDLTNNRDE